MSYQYTITSSYCYHEGEIVDMFFINGIPFTFDEITQMQKDDPYVQVEASNNITYTVDDMYRWSNYLNGRAIQYSSRWNWQIQRKCQETRSLTSLLTTCKIKSSQSQISPNTENTNMSFANLKKQSRSGSLTDKLIKKVEKLNSGEKSSDDRFWKPEVDKAGNGYAVIRFLPAPEGCELPSTSLESRIQGPGGWYIENSLTTLGQKDPVSEYNRTLWNSGRDSDKEIARKQKRKLAHYANIYVVKDPANPENEGKVFLYKFGKKIFDKITEAMQPQFADEEGINPFDFSPVQTSNLRFARLKVTGTTTSPSSTLLQNFLTMMMRSRRCIIT